MTGLERRAGGVLVRTASGATVRASQVVVATSAYSAWLRRLGSLFVPVYDYVLVSGAARRPTSGGPSAGRGARACRTRTTSSTTSGSRPTTGSCGAATTPIHYPGSRVGPELDRRPATFEKLEAQFFRAFPQLEGLRFPFRWGGAIDTTTRGSRSRSARRWAAA